MRPVVGCMVGLACLIAIAAGSVAQAQSGPDAIYGVTSLDVAPDAVAKGSALLQQYREAARKQAGNLGVDQIVFDVPDGAGSGNMDVNLQAGSTFCGPPPIPGCHFSALNMSNTVKLPVR